MKNKKRIIQIFVPVLLLVIVAGIWIIKSVQTGEDNSQDQNSNVNGVDFSLVATEEIDYAALFEYKLPIIVDYGADSCGPCIQMAPALETLNAEYSGKAFIKFVDVFKYSGAYGNVPLQVLPTQIFFNADGTPFVPSEELAAKIEFSMYSSKDDNTHIFTTHMGVLTESELREILKEMGVE